MSNMVFSIIFIQLYLGGLIYLACLLLGILPGCCHARCYKTFSLVLAINHVIIQSKILQFINWVSV